MILFKSCNKVNELEQSNSNQISKDTSTQVMYTVEEMQEFIKQHDSTNAINVKPKFIRQLIKVALSYKDSLKIANNFNRNNNDDEVSETLTEDDIRGISVIKDCYKLNVISYPDSSNVDVKFNSDITTIIYEKWKYKGFFKRLFNKFNIPFWDFTKIVDSKSILECSGDTLPVQNNIRVYR